jgi:cell division protein FtsQ
VSRHAATRVRQRDVLAERTIASPQRLRRLTKWVLALGVTVTVIVLGLQWVLHRPYFRVEQVVVTGNHHESVAAVLGRSGLASHPSMVNLNESLLKQRLETLPWVGSVTVTKKWPHTVELAIHENVAVAVAFSSSHELEYVDAQGRDLGRAPLHENLPTLEYLGVTSASWPYQDAGRAAAYVASKLPVAFATQVSTITDDPQGSVTLHMTTPVTFIVGPATNLHAKFVAIASVIAHSTLVPGDVVDVTVPDELAVTPPSG